MPRKPGQAAKRRARQPMTSSQEPEEEKTETQPAPDLPTDPPAPPAGEEEEAKQEEEQAEEGAPAPEEEEHQVEDAARDAAEDKAHAAHDLITSARGIPAGEEVKIPDALTADEAVAALQDAGFQVGEVDTDSNTIVIL